MRTPILVAAVLFVAACYDNRTPAASADAATPLSCLPNLDGRIDRDELPLRVGAAARYVVESEATVDLSGDAGGWSFDPSGETLDIATAPILGRWYAGEFSDADFVLADGELEGVYRIDERGLYLLGLASPDAEPAAGPTLLAYAEPVALLRFPLEVGVAWTAESASSGVLDGLPFSSTDRYDVAVSDHGEVDLGSVRLDDALRVDVAVEIAPEAGGQATTRRQTSFWFECFGEVVRATSRDGETDASFTIARELRVLAP